jgi:hypothetical protein
MTAGFGRVRPSSDRPLLFLLVLSAAEETRSGALTCAWLPAVCVLAAAPHSVAVDLSALDRQTYAEIEAVTMERMVVLRLVQEGFAVVAPNGDAKIVIRFSRRDRVLELSASGASAEVKLDMRRIRELHLEVAQKTSDLARAASQRLLPEPDTTPPPQALPPETPAPPSQPQWTVLVGGGVLMRAPGVDWRGVVAIQWNPARVGLHLELGLAPAPGPLTAYDGSMLAGAGLRLLSSPLRLDIGLSLGAILHTYSVEVLGSDDHFGARVDFLVRPFLRAAFNPVSGLLLWAQVGGGLASRAREHRLQGTVLYARGALWFEPTLGLGWEL